MDSPLQHLLRGESISLANGVSMGLAEIFK